MDESAPRRARPQGISDRTAATFIGLFYITGTVAGILGLMVTKGAIFDGPDYLGQVASLGNGLPTGAMLTLVMGLALALIPVVAYPILRATSQRLALGYLVFRGALETTGYIITAVAWLALFQLARTNAPGSTSPSGLQDAGAALAHIADMTGLVVPFFFLAGAAMFYSVLFRARLVPRWISGWGLIAILPSLTGALLAVYAVLPTTSTTIVVLDIPMAIQEMVLAVWLIARGFHRVATPQPSRRPGRSPDDLGRTPLPRGYREG